MDKLLQLTSEHLYRGILTNGTDEDFDIIALAKRTPGITFNELYLQRGFVPGYYETPFKQIKFQETQKCVKPEYAYITKAIQSTTKRMDDYCDDLIEATLNYFRAIIDPTEKYLVLHSAGFDSRIMSMALMMLRDEIGEDFTQNFHFRCHQPEGPMFIEIMKRQGWHPDQYSVYDGPYYNYYNIGRSDLPLNGFQNYNQQMKFWNDIVPEKDEKNWNLIIGLGGEVYKYLAKYSHETPTVCQNKALHLLLNHNPGRGEWEGLYQRWFKSLLMPFFSYSYLAQSLKVNPVWCKFNGETDSIRYHVVKRLSDRTGVDCLQIPYGKHDYSWNISSAFKKEMLRIWMNSRFYNDHGYKLNLTEFTINMYGFEAKMWGLMTVYDEIFN